MAVIIPLGLLLLLAVGYIGRALIERQGILAAARQAAREASMAATRSPLDKATGAGVVKQASTAGERAANASAAMGKQVESVPPAWGGALETQQSRLQPIPLGPYGMGYAAEHSEVVDGQSMKFKLGFVLYGARIKERLAFLEPARKQTAAASKLLPNPAPGLGAPLEVSGAAFMPGEVPLHHPQIGLVESNDWIRQILEGTH
jgi:hypothetical protein